MNKQIKQFEEAARAIGIEIENVKLSTTDKGVGVFVVDKAKPVRIALPQRVLLPTDDVDYETNLVKDSIEVDDDLREFWNLYLDINLGSKQLEQRRALEQAIARDHLDEWQKENHILSLDSFLKVSASDAEMRRKVADARPIINRKTKRIVYMPYLDFLNHKHPSLDFQWSDDYLYTEGLSDTDEIYISYGDKDSINILNTYDFYSPSAYAFASPCEFTLPNGTRIYVSDFINKRISIPNKSAAPFIARKENKIMVSYCLLGIDGYPDSASYIWKLGLEHADVLNNTEKTNIYNLLGAVSRRSYHVLEHIYRKGEAVKDKRLRELLTLSAQSVMKNIDV